MSRTPAALTADVSDQASNQPRRVALDWLREKVRSEFPQEALFDAAGPRSVVRAPPRVEHEVWRREWKRQWRRFQLADQLVAFSGDLDCARSADDVYTALAEHAARIVGAYACLLFIGDGTANPIRALPNRRLRTEAGDLQLRVPVRHAGVVMAGVGTRRDHDPFEGLRPLFTEHNAACLAHAPLNAHGTMVLVERRRERVWEDDDWHLLRSLALQAETALERVRLLSKIARVSLADPVTGLVGRAEVDAVLEHAWAGARQGEPLALVALSTGTVDDATMRSAAEALRQETAAQGVVVRYGSCEFLVVLPQTGSTEASGLADRLRERLARKVKLRIGIAHWRPEDQSAADLTRRAEHARDNTGSPN